jgi:hypothetical protein
MSEPPPDGARSTAPQELPDWVPPMWTRGRMNRAFWRSPGRMLVWFCAAPLAAAAVTIASALSGGRTWLVFAAVTVLLARQSVVYGPRALRAHRG